MSAIHHLSIHPSTYATMFSETGELWEKLIEVNVQHVPRPSSALQTLVRSARGYTPMESL